MGDRPDGRHRRKLYKSPPPSSAPPFHQTFLLDDEAASSTDLARISAFMNQIYRSSLPLPDDPRKHLLSRPLIALNPSAVTVVPSQRTASPFYPEPFDGSTEYGYGTHNTLYDSYMRTAVDPTHVPDPPLSCPNSHSSAESSAMARSPTNLHLRSKKPVSRSASTSHIIRRWSMLHVPDETLAVELEQLRRITRIRQRKKSDKATTSFTRCQTSAQFSASPLDANSDQIRFPAKDDYLSNDGAHADATLSGAFVYGGPGLRQKFWLVDDDEEDAQSDEDDISDPSDDDSDTPEDVDDPQTPPDAEEHQEQAWKLAREALFCCRELVRTEKTYFSKLVQLKDGQTLTPPPSILTSYLPALILASNTFLEHCSQDPTAYGISTAFLQSSAQLEHALVAYCGIVGDIFATKRASRRKLVRSRKSSSAVDESKQPPLPNDNGPSSDARRRSFNPPPSPQLSFFGISEKRKSVPMAGRSSFDVSYQFPADGIPPLPVPPTPAEAESPQDPKTLPRRSFSLFRRTTYPVPLTSKLSKSSWRPFRSSNKTSAQCPGNSIEPIESLPQQMNRVPPRPTRPIPPVPQETPPMSEPSELNKGTNANARRYHNRSASLQETHMPPPESPSLDGWDLSNPMKRGGTSLDMNHIGSFEISTRSSHNLLFGTEGREKIPTMRDLAIVPAQRVVRYVLLFKDILDHTPEDVPTRPLIVQAFHEALRIAEKCDRAQGNAAFLRKS